MSDIPSEPKSSNNELAKTIVAKSDSRASDGPNEASLVQIYGPDLGRRFILDGEVTIGRDSDNHIVLDTDQASRRHGRILVLERQTLYEDMGSTNGTQVNDQQVEQCLLANGDIIKVGSVIFKYLSSGNAEALYHEEIYRMTIVDGLTQIPNRRYFNDFIERELARARRHDRPLSVALLDIDHFKQVNDNYGHLAGDYVLRRFADVANSLIRREQLFARYGGEEFAIVMPEMDANEASLLCEKIRHMVESEAFEFDQEPIAVTVSIGISCWEEEMGGLDEFLQETDNALYQAKESGRNRVCLSGQT